jgi:hypothetical protein
MLRIRKQLRGRVGFHQHALFHHRHALRKALHQIQVVRDQQHGHAALGRFLFLQADQQIDDLLAHGHVEGGGRFVGEQQARPARERHRDHRALPLAARQLMRETVDAPFRLGNTGTPQQLDAALARRVRAACLRAGAGFPRSACRP